MNENSQPVPVVEQYKFLSEQTRHFHKQINAAFELFIKIFSGLIAATAWLSSQREFQTAHPHYGRLADALALILAVCTCILIADNLGAWYRAKRTISAISGFDAKQRPNIPAPRGSAYAEWAMIAAVIVSCALFVLSNPLPF